MLILEKFREFIIDRKMQCVVYWLGQVEYGEAYGLQKKLWSQRLDGQTEDAVLLLSHPPTVTIGKSGKLDNLLLARDGLAREGISLFFTDRGGDITYHGPGQLVAYPIIDLRNRGRDVHRYIHELQEVVIRTLADLSIEAHRDGKYVGIWVGNDKIAAIGVRISRWITMHGLALNVNSDLEHFSYINPCGILERGVTSIARVLSRNVPMEAVADGLVRHFSDVFDTEVEWRSPDLLRCRS